MPARKLDYLSEHLRATRNRLAELRHGGIVLVGDDLEAFIRRFGDFIDMALNLENEISRRQWNDCAHRGPKVVDIDVAIGGNVVAFPGHSPDHRPTGGAA